MLRGGGLGAAAAATATAVSAAEFKGCISRMMEGLPGVRGAGAGAGGDGVGSVEGGRIALAFSGGPDSLALCALARKVYPRARLVAFFVDHNLAERGVSEDAALVARRLDELDIEGRTLRMEWAAGRAETLSKGQMQEVLRERRYRMLLEACVAAGARILLTGHNLEDDIVTMFYRMSHGSGVEGMGGMRLAGTFPVEHACAGSFFVGHPLAGIAKARLVETCRALGAGAGAGAGWNVDKSNGDLDYRRNAVLAGLARLEGSGHVTVAALREALGLFKDFRRDMHREIGAAFERSVAVNRVNGDATLVLNEERWLRIPSVATRVMALLSQFTSAKHYPPRTRRIVEMHRQLVGAFEKHQAATKHWLASLPPRLAPHLAPTDLQPIDLTRRVACGQMTIGGATFYPLSRTDAVRRVEHVARLANRQLAYGPSFLVQREPPTRIDNQKAAFMAAEVVLSPGEKHLWDGRVYLDFTVRAGAEAGAKRFRISFATVADVREFEGRSGGNTAVRRRIYSYMATTPGTHLYQIPVVREAGTEYIAFPTLQTEWPVGRYQWRTQYAGLSVLNARFQCLP